MILYCGDNPGQTRYQLIVMYYGAIQAYLTGHQPMHCNSMPIQAKLENSSSNTVHILVKLNSNSCNLVAYLWKIGY
jgi:hypothetical protein